MRPVVEIPCEAGGSFWRVWDPSTALRMTEISGDPGIRGRRRTPRTGQPRARPEHAEGPGCPHMSILLHDPANSALPGSRAFAHGLFHLERIQNGGDDFPRLARVHEAAETHCAGDDVSKFGFWQSAQSARGSL